MGHRVHVTSLDGLILDEMCVYCVIVFSACLSIHGWLEALNRSLGAWLAYVIV
jgi:hypothetical protein